MRRLKQQFELELQGRAAQAVCAELDAAAGVFKGPTNGLIVAKRDGLYVLHVREDRYSSKPVLRAGVTDGPPGAAVRGTVRETRSSRWTGALYAVAIVVLAGACVGAGAAHAWFVLIPGVPGVLVFCALLVSHRGARRTSFDDGVRELRDALSHWFMGPPAAPPEPIADRWPGDPATERRLADLMLGVADTLDSGGTDADCEPQLRLMRELAGRELAGGRNSTADVDQFTDFVVQEYREAGPADRAAIRRQLEAMRRPG